MAVAGDAAMSDDQTDHRKLAVGYFNAAWDLIDLPTRTAEQDRDMLSVAAASRQHWVEAGGTVDNLAVADWQVAHAASLAGFADVALPFAQAAVDRAESADVPTWLKASMHEGLARAHAAAGDRMGYEREAALSQSLLETVTETEDRELIESQLASIPVPS
jgi:hypothetical protein